MKDIEKFLFIEKYSLEELIEKNIKNLPQDSLLKQIIKEYKKKGKNIEVYFVERGSIKKLIEYIIGKDYREAEANIKNILGDYSFVADYILSDLNWFLNDLKDIREKVSQEELSLLLYILFPFGIPISLPDKSQILKYQILLYTTNDPNKLIPVLLHEYLHLLRLDLDVWISLQQNGFVEKLEKNVQEEFLELTAELIMIYLLENAGLRELVDERKRMIKEVFQEYQKLKEKLGIDREIERERKMIAYLKAYELIRNDEIRKIVEGEIKKYLEKLRCSIKK
jgi:hypothetical protein